MALTGTLEDISVVDLLQYPQAGRRTGQMVIQTADAEAHIYYHKGDLVHAEMGREEGFEVLVGVLDWTEGRFAFHNGVEAGRKTLRGQVVHLVMEAVRENDERKRKLDEEKRESVALQRLKAEFGANGQTDPVLFQHLVEFVRSYSFPVHATLVDEAGTVLAEASEKGRKPSHLEQIRQSTLSLLRSYPRSALTRMCLEDGEGPVVVTRVGNGLTLVAIAMDKAPVGAISMGSNKLAGNLAKG